MNPSVSSVNPTLQVHVKEPALSTHPCKQPAATSPTAQLHVWVDVAHSSASERHNAHYTPHQVPYRTKNIYLTGAPVCILMHVMPSVSTWKPDPQVQLYVPMVLIQLVVHPARLPQVQAKEPVAHSSSSEEKRMCINPFEI